MNKDSKVYKRIVYVVACHLFLHVDTDKNGWADFINLTLDFFDISEQELAYKIRVSPPTVSRWVAGKSEPYPATKRALVCYLLQEVLNG